MGRFDAQAAAELHQLVSEYWHELDGNQGRDIADFYTEDCTFVAGSFYSASGQDGVRQFYKERATFVADEKDGVRTTRHCHSNLRMSFPDDGSAQVDFVMTNYSGGGHPPIKDFAGPSMVSDISWRCRRNDSGRWKIASFLGTPLFIAPEDFTERFLNRAQRA